MRRLLAYLILSFGVAWALAGAAASAPPVFSLPGPITVEATGADGANVTYTASASNGSGPAPITCTPPGASSADGTLTTSTAGRAGRGPSSHRGCRRKTREKHATQTLRG